MVRRRRKNNLRVALLMRGLTDAEFARRIGASEGHVNKVAAGTAQSSERLRRLCALTLDLPVDELFPLPWRPPRFVPAPPEVADVS